MGPLSELIGWVCFPAALILGPDPDPDADPQAPQERLQFRQRDRRQRLDRAAGALAVRRQLARAG